MEPTEIKPGEAGSPFWRFSLHFYSRPGVAEACLSLQDRCGIDVNLLLFLLWMSLCRRTLSADALRALDERIHEWRETVVGPLRTMRRALKRAVTLVEPSGAERFRGRLKALELEAERLQQEAMAAAADSAADGTAETPDEAAWMNVAAYQSVSSRDFPPGLVEFLLAALRDIDGRAFADNTASWPPR